jgi:hypothetical protein
MSTAPVPTPPKRSNDVWWVLGVLGVAIVALVFTGLSIASYIVRRARVTESSKNVEISTPVGNIQVEKGSKQHTGLPVYPGATTINTGGASIEFPSTDGARVSVTAVKYFTPDSLEKVSAWYQEQLGAEFQREAPAHVTHRIESMDAGNADVAYIDDGGDALRMVALKRKPGGVEIGLARMGKQEAQ